MLIDLGESILEVIKKTPDGMLIFFPSYIQMDKTYDLWEENGIINKIEKHKSVYKEPKSSSRFKQVRKGFEKDAVSRGAVLIGVCKGKVSEGLDFSDRAARCVIVIGMPYAQWKDPKVQLKMSYLDTKNKQGILPFNGRDWYNQEASRAINQAIGRVIRHRYDYGLILLIDERYTNKFARNERSKWIRDTIILLIYLHYNDALLNKFNIIDSRQTNYDNFENLITDVDSFFKDMESRNFPSKKEYIAKNYDSNDDSNEKDSRRNSTDSNHSVKNQIGQNKGDITRFFRNDKQNKNKAPAVSSIKINNVVQNNSNTQKANNLFSNPGSVGLGKIGRQSESNINLSQNRRVIPKTATTSSLSNLENKYSHKGKKPFYKKGVPNVLQNSQKVMLKPVDSASSQSVEVKLDKDLESAKPARSFAEVKQAGTDKSLESSSYQAPATSESLKDIQRK